MDRPIVYDAELPQTTDVLNAGKFAMIGNAFTDAAILGETGFTPAPPYVHGLACTPTSPASLQVNVGVGSIYAEDEVDATAYGDLGTDTNTVLKQGILYNPVTLTITPPGTAGFSQVYLVEVIINDIDSGAQVANYYNANNPAQPFQGPNNDGMSQFTTRTCVCQVALKAGIAATTGSQTTPSPDAGYTGLYAITVANGQTQITSGNIVTLATAPFFPKLPAVPYDVQTETWIYCTDTSTGGAAPATNGTTTTASAVLNFASVPSYITVGMKAFDLTTTTAITGGQTVQSKTATTVTLTANVNATVGSGDFIAFSNNTMAASVAPIPPALVPGLCVKVMSAGTNSGATTFNLNSLGAVAIHRANGANAAPGDISANQILELVYDGSAWQIVNFEGSTATTTTTNNNTFITSIPYGVDGGSVNALSVPFNPVISSLSAGLLILVKVANTNTGPATIVVNANAAVPIVDCSGQPLVASMIFAGDVALMVYDGTSFELVNRLNYQQNAFTLYVNGASGNDNNNGLTSGTAFATIQKAFNVAGQYPPGPNTITINIADWSGHTYAAGVTPNYAIPPLNIVGTSQANTVIDGLGGQPALYIRGFNNATISNMTLQSTGGSFTSFVDEIPSTYPVGLLVTRSVVTVGANVKFGTAAASGMWAFEFGEIQLTNSFAIGVGNSDTAVRSDVCSVVNFGSITVTCTSMNLNTGFVFSDAYGSIQLLNTPSNPNFSGYGSVQGPHYAVNDFGRIETNGAGASFFPGNSSGQNDGTGQYN